MGLNCPFNYTSPVFTLFLAEREFVLIFFLIIVTLEKNETHLEHSITFISPNVPPGTVTSLVALALHPTN